MRFRPLLLATIGLALLVGEAPRALATTPRPADVALTRQAALRLGHERPAAVIRWLRTQGSVSSARLGRDGQTVDIRFRDGRETLVLPARLSSERVPLSALAVRAHVAALQNPAPRALVLEPFASQLFPGDSSNVGAPEVTVLQSAGFQVSSAYDAAVTVNLMRSLASYDVVYLHGHSGTTATGDAVLATGQLANNDPSVAPYLSDGSVVAVGVAQSTNVYYAVTSRFFTAHVSPFPQHSILFLNGCQLLPATVFWSTLASRGVGAMISWSDDALPTDEFVSAATFFNFLGQGQTVAGALQSTLAAGFGKSTYNGVTATLGYRGDGTITLALAAGGQGTPPTSTPRPTATSVPSPTRTRTPVPTGVVPRPSDTSIPFVLRIAGLARQVVSPGQRQTVKVESSPNTGLVLFRIMPNGAQSLFHLATGASGAAEISFKQPGSAITRHNRRATVAVRMGNDAQDREVTATYTIGFGKIDLAVDRHAPVGRGTTIAIWVHTTGRSRVDLAVAAPSRRAVGMRSTTGGNGWVEFRYRVPRNMPANQTLSITASARRSGKLVIARSKLLVG